MKKTLLFLALYIVLSSHQSIIKTDPMDNYKKILPTELSENTTKLISEDWMLITSGNQEKYNTMTASWGGFGNLWNKNVTFIFVRPQRYTFEFLEKSETYTLSFFDHAKYKEALTICGTKSGRDVDKIQLAGLTPLIIDSNSIAFTEARIIVECKIVYSDFMKAELIDQSILKETYPNKDFHKMYIGEIINMWIKKD